MIRAIRIRLYPTPDQKKYLAGLFGAVRFCYNKALYLKTHFYKVKGVNLHPIHDLKEALQKPSLILRPENFCLLHKLNFCANDCSGYF